MSAQMIATAIALALLAALAEWFFGGIREPWRKIVIIGIVILLVAGILSLVGLLPNFGALTR
jgi:hypothetical protein